MSRRNFYDSVGASMTPFIGLFLSWAGLIGFGTWLAANRGDLK